MRLLTNTVGVIAITVLIFGVAEFAMGQASPDTTALLKEAGVTTSEVQSNAHQKGLAGEKAAPSARYDLPFGASGNKLVLSVRNTSGQLQQSVTVSVQESPQWVTFTSDQVTVPKISDGATGKVQFSFDVAEDAPIGEQGLVTLQASAPTGMVWEKSFSLQVAPPDQFELLPNYPNPFNPTTTIQYRLPVQMDVQVSVYNILGRKVATLADGLQEAGQQELRWDASNMASGLYFYRVIAEGSDGKQIIKNHKMMLIK